MLLGSICRQKHTGIPGSLLQQISLVRELLRIENWAPLGNQQRRRESSSAGGNSDKATPLSHGEFDQSLLEYLVCPLSKQPLRYDETRKELVNDALGVAYSVQDGIPNLLPTDGRFLHPQPNETA